jgi:hypothetical protein
VSRRPGECAPNERPPAPTLVPAVLRRRSRSLTDTHQHEWGIQFTARYHRLCSAVAELDDDGNRSRSISVDHRVTTVLTTTPAQPPGPHRIVADQLTTAHQPPRTPPYAHGQPASNYGSEGRRASPPKRADFVTNGAQLW